MKEWCVLWTAVVVLPVAAGAVEAPKALAISTLEKIERLNDLLPGAIRSGDKADLWRFIEQPAMAKFDEWPPMADERYAGYRRCQFAIDSFRIYAGDQFKARGQLLDTEPAAKDFLEQKRLCVRAIKTNGARPAD